MIEDVAAPWEKSLSYVHADQQEVSRDLMSSSLSVGSCSSLLDTCQTSKDASACVPFGSIWLFLAGPEASDSAETDFLAHHAALTRSL